MITVEAKLELPPEHIKTLKDLMCKYSAMFHTAYNQLCRNVIPSKPQLRIQFEINGRYVDAAVTEAKALHKAQTELGQNPQKIIFGSKKLFLKLKKRHLSQQHREGIKRQYRETRKYNLFSIAETSRKGNQNIQIQGNQLRINVGNRQWIYATIITKHKKWKQLLNASKYTVKIMIRNNEIHAYFSFDEPLPEESVTFKNGVIGIDLNARPANIAWAEVDQEGNYLDSGTINTPELYDCSGNKRDWYVWKYVKEVIEIAKAKNKGIVIEDLKTSGINRATSNFCRAKLRDAFLATAARHGVKVIQVYPAYTSMIGCVKYSPIYNLTRHESAALVIGRRGLGFKENIPKAYKSLACDVNEVGVTQQKKETKSLLKQFGKIYRVCKIAVLTEQFTKSRGRLPNWFLLRQRLLCREECRFRASSIS